MSQDRADRAVPPTGASKSSPRVPTYKLVLLRDLSNDLMFVIRTVMELTHLCRAEATHKMWEAHHSGRSVVFITYRERAEWYAERFVSRGLQAMIEPA